MLTETFIRTKADNMIAMAKTAMSEPKRRKDLIYAFAILSTLTASAPAIDAK